MNKFLNCFMYLLGYFLFATAAIAASMCWSWVVWEPFSVPVLLCALSFTVNAIGMICLKFWRYPK